MRVESVQSQAVIVPFRVRKAFIHSSCFAASVGMSASLLLSACAADVGSPGDPSQSEGTQPGAASEANVVARAQLADGREIKYVEPEPGILVESEIGRSDALSAPEPEGMNFVERYEFLTGMPAPDALVQAQRRAGDTAGQVEGSDGTEQLKFESAQTSTVVPKSSVRPAQAVSSWDFRNWYCAATDRHYFFLNQTGWVSWQASGVNYLKSGLRCDTNLCWATMYYSTNLANKNEALNEWVPAGMYVAIRAATTLNADVSLFGQGNDSGSSFDLCWNWHY